MRSELDFNKAQNALRDRDVLKHISNRNQRPTCRARHRIQFPVLTAYAWYIIAQSSIYEHGPNGHILNTLGSYIISHLVVIHKACYAQAVEDSHAHFYITILESDFY